jgi:hypothetical protein
MVALLKACALSRDQQVKTVIKPLSNLLDG